MEVGPTCHYVMGGVEVDPDTQQSRRFPGCSRSARSPAACTAPTGSAATRCPTCWCSACARASPPPTTSAAWPAPGPAVADADVVAAQEAALAPLALQGGENPYAIQSDLQQTMNDLVGIIRKAEEIEQALVGPAGPARPGGQGQRRGRPVLQPRLAPRARPAQHAGGLRVRGQGRAAADRVPRRPHPRRPPGHGAGVAQGQPGLLADRGPRGRGGRLGRQAAAADHAARAAVAVRLERAVEVHDAGRAGAAAERAGRRGASTADEPEGA